MDIINFEFKARAGNLDKLEKKLLELKPIYKGEDHQIDTYFNVASGFLKLREGNIENSLIYYERESKADAKLSKIMLYKHAASPDLKDILTKLHGVKVVVDKKRKIYFIDNIKFHFDRVEDLGTFVEVEAIDKKGKIGIEKLQKQCAEYFLFFELKNSDYVDKSYSDLLLESS